MSTLSSQITTRDGVSLYWREWGQGAPVLFVHSWALQSRMWDYQFAALGDRMRCLAFDRRGHGRSDCPPTGYDYDTLADDLADVINTLDLRELTLVGHSMGGSEIVRYLTRHGSSRVKRIALIAPVLPYLTKTADNPLGVPEEKFEMVRALWQNDFPKWIVDNTPPFFIPETSEQMMQWGARLLMETSVPVAIECNRAVTCTDFRAELPKIDVPTLLIHGTKDASVPIDLAGSPTAALIPHCTFKVYEGAPHGLMYTHAEQLHADLCAFVGV
ncbi:alpha/beta hydrolase [Dyella monticola]|uniref:Alpha/beta hydrolase n=1 Tax=Dyella monticola TaxID=1927958 RepID=A0A370X5Q0_9GAMM|nr:alpha/beta hydrolase [Dyella monticola]RDS83610.1 alpha/beta hydrolase [Dyella monticola]